MLVSKGVRGSRIEDRGSRVKVLDRTSPLASTMGNVEWNGLSIVWRPVTMINASRCHMRPLLQRCDDEDVLGVFINSTIFWSPVWYTSMRAYGFALNSMLNTARIFSLHNGHTRMVAMPSQTLLTPVVYRLRGDQGT